MASGVDGDKRWQAVDRDGGRDPITLSIDYGDRAGLRIDDVDLIADRVHSHVSGIGANLQGAVLTEIHKIEHGDRIGAAVADVGELPIAFRDIGKAAPTAAREAKEETAESGCNGLRGRGSEGVWHYSESIEVSWQQQAEFSQDFRGDLRNFFGG
jgi:hypothetical protein